MKRKLHQWLDETHAVMPVPDPEYTVEKEEAYRTHNNARILKSQETTRQNMMKREWSPNATWWDSRTVD